MPNRPSLPLAPFHDVGKVVFRRFAGFSKPHGDETAFFLHGPAPQGRHGLVGYRVRIGNVDAVAAWIKRPAVERTGDVIACYASFAAAEVGAKVRAVGV